MILTPTISPRVVLDNIKFNIRIEFSSHSCYFISNILEQVLISLYWTAANSTFILSGVKLNRLFLLRLAIGKL